MPDSMRQISWAISPEVWSVRLNHDYIGCLGDFTVNNQPWDLDLEMRACWAEGRLHQNCYPPFTGFDWCENQGCKNGGLCSPGWNRQICDCTNTNFMGDLCGDDSSPDPYPLLGIQLSLSVNGRYVVKSPGTTTSSVHYTEQRTGNVRLSTYSFLL
ncbi:hypothetical protein AHF37_06562 [Paragonimus kellicotti]|nr:hypothetical protein AHF37_06562 [Paragonimus kellicotti]